MSQIRWMIRRDLPEMLEIEQYGTSLSWIESMYISCLRNRNCIGMVLEDKDEIRGGMIYELHRNKLHLIRLIVDVDYRHRGFGTMMINKLKSKLSSGRRIKISTHVDDTEMSVHLYLQSQGFLATRVIKRQPKFIDLYEFEFYTPEVLPKEQTYAA